MSIRNELKQALLFAVGAVATGVEALSDAADVLAQKGASVIKEGKEVFDDFCKKCNIPDDEDPAVIIEEEEISSEEA